MGVRWGRFSFGDSVPALAKLIARSIVDADKATPSTIKSEADIRSRYRSHRYLQDLPLADLQKFGRDAFRNFMTINHELKVVPLDVDHPRHSYWRARLLHIHEEYAIRAGAHPRGFDEELVRSIKLPRQNSSGVRRARSSLDLSSLPRGKYLVKYGQKQYLSDALSTGRIKISSASSYASYEKNDAIRDKELEFTFNLFEPRAGLLAKYARLPLNLDVDKCMKGTAFLKRSLRKDYYLYCLSASYDPRMFDDFDYDACLVIHDLEEFRNRLLHSVAEATHAKGWAFSPVTYVDPFSEPDPDLHHALRKHHRYAYQDEVRAAWQLPNESCNDLSPIFVELGSLKNIAELVLVGDESAP